MRNRLVQQRYMLLNIDVVALNSKWSYQDIISPYIRIYYISSGEGKLYDASGSIKLEEGYLYIIPSYTMCNMSCELSLTQYYVQFFDDSESGNSILQNIKSILKVPATNLDFLLFRRLLDINPNRGINKSYDPRKYENEVFYNDCQQMNVRQSPAIFHETQGILEQLSSRFLMESHLRSNQPTQYSREMGDTVIHILKHLDTNLSVAQLAERIGLNVDYFSRQFRKQTGIRPLSFINQKRIERAQYLMATTALNYTQISLLLKFDSVSHFSKTFKKITGLSPGVYKKQIYISGFSKD
ncbi:AraC family transcriptional regulator [Pedobacter aquatilis]|uniref:helix-turn-helix domain-containing protein n=1 Tax=Pedobacter aquatilis TaxID=351343 RepID=UPI00292EA052|nr:AraC family transcriptional regulator [Pedobacter aquatilis]